MLVIVAFMARLTHTTQQTHFQKQIVMSCYEGMNGWKCFFPF